jgi:hypothetical protein
MPFEKDPNEIGALWLHDGPKGPYMTGEINGEKVVCFRSKSGSAKAPAWNVLKSKPRGEAAPTATMHNANKPDALVDDIEF